MLIGSIPISISIGYLCVSDEYHLFVGQVTLEDDVMFECQVGPAGGDPPLKTQVQLSVISKCPSVCLSVCVHVQECRQVSEVGVAHPVK